MKVSSSKRASPQDPLRGRRPTSHERAAGQPWNASYQGGPAPWEIGAPQPAVLRLIAEGRFTGAVLDAGCGSGENACAIAAHGGEVLGIDVAETAIVRARGRAAATGVRAEFALADALNLDTLGRRFDTVLDCALFHAFDNPERRAYAASLGSVIRPGGRLYLLCFAPADTEEGAGPHPVSQPELTAPFRADTVWRIDSIEAEVLLSRFAPEGVPAWSARIVRREPQLGAADRSG